MFIKLYIARPTYHFFVIYACGLRVVIKRICCVVGCAAELGDYDADVHTADCVSRFQFVPRQSAKLDAAILHKFSLCTSAAARSRIVDSK